MKHSVIAVALLAGCASAPQAPRQSPQPQPQPQKVAHSPNAMTPVSNAKSIAEPRIRVGMLSDQASVKFPRIDGGYFLVADGGASTLRRGFTADAPMRTPLAMHYAVQVIAYSDKPTADAFAAKLRTEIGQRVDEIFDPSAANGGVYRIFAGEFPDEAGAIALRDQLAQRGYPKDMLIARRPSDQQFDKKVEITDDEGDHYTIPTASLLVMPQSANTIAIGEKEYRTAVRLFINLRGQFNVINELNIEDYLRGVVPAEMGPRVYDELEALKAQAIAARTYAFRNLGQFRVEGFDICPGPACQAYLGYSGEEALSTQAVDQTAGLVMTYGGRPVDALYTATCGGETSDVQTMFPNRNEPYLKRVRCVELDMLSLAGRADSGILTEMQVNARVFAALAGVSESGSWSARDVASAVSAVIPVNVAPPASSRRGDVLRYLADAMNASAYATTLTLPEDRKYFFPQSSATDDAAHLAAAFLVKYGFWPAQEIDKIDLNAAMPRDELLAILNVWLRKHAMLNDVTGKIAALEGRRITLKAEGKLTPYTLPANIPIFRRLGDRYEEYANVPIMVGDRAVISLNARRVPVAAIVVANYDGASFDRTSSFANWTRSYRADELAASINKRFPIQQLVDLKPVTIDASQRIAELEYTAEGGRKFTAKGLPIRWSLNVPDNLFVIEKTKDPDGMDRYTFYGKGWGHGVGMCQVGAYGMAFRGWKYDQILKHYYTGIEIVPLSTVQPAPNPPSPPASTPPPPQP
ncbi:MAG TPA: SpoIID/LytB domain-containing protein [Thermoanaerobaculia bacterium]